jgi:peptide/nickel transport system ATP-binding protein
MNPSDATPRTETPAPKDALLEVTHLAVDYVDPPQPPAQALRDISFTLHRGEAIGIVGESGCGKSTLMLALMRLLPAAGRIQAGEIRLGGSDLLALSDREMAALRWKRIAMIFQGAMNALNPVRTVGDQIAEAIRLHDGVTDRPTLDRRVSELLDLVGIAASRREQYPFQYSGGMRQRAMIAMALACSPDIVIADEPTTALDVMVQAQILQLLADLRHRLSLSILLVTHDLGIVAELCDRVLVMYGGVLAEVASVDTIYNEPAHPYTQELLKAFPDPTKPLQRLASIPGSPPRLNALPPGCRFAPRCPHVHARCNSAQPPIYTLSQNHQASCYLVEAQAAERKQGGSAP